MPAHRLRAIVQRIFDRTKDGSPPTNPTMTAEQALEKLEALQAAFPSAEIKGIALLIMRQELVIESAAQFLMQWHDGDCDKLVTKAMETLVNRTHEGSFNLEARQENTP